MAARTAEDVAVMENELNYYRQQLEMRDRELAIALSEKSRLQIENALLGGKAQENLVKATRMETIMQSVSSGLLAGLKEMQQERDLARAVRRQVQEDHLVAESGAPPAFLDRTVPYSRPIMVQRPRIPPQDEIARAEQLRGAAEHVSSRGRLGAIDPTLAAQDSRIPPNEFPGGDTEDEEALRKLADDMSKGA